MLKEHLFVILVLKLNRFLQYLSLLHLLLRFLVVPAIAIILITGLI